MNDDELKHLWQQQPLREPTPSAAQLISAMQKQTSQFRRILDARDLRELVACGFVVMVFAGFAFTLHAEQPVSRLGDWITIAATIFIAWKLIYTRRSTPAAPPGATIVESLRAELNSVRAQSRLLGSVLWWYLLPGFIGLVVMTWGNLPIHDPVSLWVMVPTNILVTLFFVAVDLFIYRLNQRARTTQLLPLEAQLNSLLHSAETGEPLDETHAADLRPIALSLAVADQIKPVEFRVDFWQIALFGEIGFLGIWLFMGIAPLVSNDDRKTNEPVSRIVSVEETSRYSTVARQVVDLLNAHDYAGVQELFNAPMSEALPPEKATRFFTDLSTRFGNIGTVDGPTGNGYRDWIAFRLHCQRGELLMSLALGSDDRIAGIHFKPMLGSLVDIKSFVPRPFGLLHLTLIVPFFLAGLLFSWLLQKATERAVGISPLGVHLYQGINLMLWDEIKEVRPLRVLNICSLWLVKESGKKTVMPWTSLEHHSHLKAAVEASAPAKHPIRQYLSLLRRTSVAGQTDAASGP